MNDSLLPEAVVRHAGLVMVHAAVVVSVLKQDELICPFAVVAKGENRQSIEFEAESQDQAVSDAWSSLERYKEHIDLWGMAREGMVSGPNGKKDALVVAVWAHGMSEAAIFTQQFRHRGSEFELVGPIQIQGQASTEEVHVMKGWFHQGIDQHPKAARWWSWAGAAQQVAPGDCPDEASGSP